MNSFTKVILFIVLVFASHYSEAQVNANFTSLPTGSCVPLTVTFTNTSTNATSYQWNFGNGSPVVNTTSQGQQSTTYTIGGTYTVTLIATGSSGSSTKTQSFTFYDTSVVDFVGAPLGGCPPVNTFFQSTLLSGPSITTYNWVFGGGGSANTAAPSKTFSNAGYFNVSLQVTNSAGCISSIQKPAYIHVYDHPLAAFSASSTTLCNVGSSTVFSSNTTGGQGPYTTSWSFGDGGTGTGSPVSHAYNALGNYDVRLIVTDVNGCADTLLLTNYIHVIHLAASFTSPATACVNQSCQVSDISSPLATTCDWNFGDGGTGLGLNTSHQYTVAGVYTIRMIAHSGPCADTAYRQITINPKPVMAFTASTTTPCEAPVTITFNNTTTGAGSYTWYFGDGGTSNQQSPSYTYASNGFYDVVLYASTPLGCTDSIKFSNYIKVYPFNLAIIVDSPSICVPQTVHFTYNATSVTYPSLFVIPYPYAITSWSWDFGDGGTSNAQYPSHLYTTYGTYTVTLTVTTSNGCTKTFTYTLHAGTLPNVNFGAIPTTICNHRFVQFIDSSSQATGWSWNFGDGGTSTAQNPSHSYNVPGTYPVMLIVQNNGCFQSFTRNNYIRVNYPLASGTPDISCTLPNTVTFTNHSLNYNGFTWYFGDGSSSTQLNPAHTYASVGTYNAYIVAWNDTTGCADTSQIPVNLVQIGTSYVASDTLICKGDAVTFSAVISGGMVHQYSWYAGSAGSFADTTPVITITFPTAGVFAVTLQVKDEHNCIHTYTRNVIVSWPAVTFIASPLVACAPANVLFTDNTPIIPGTTITSRVWDFGNGVPVSVSGPNTSHYYALPGDYYVKLKVTTNAGCVDSLTNFSYIHVQRPIAGFVAAQTTSCPGTAVQFVSTSQGASLTLNWNFGDGTLYTGVNPQHTYTTLGTYTVTLIVVDNAGCRDTLVKPAYISIIGKPNAAFTMSDTFRICSPMFVNFTNSSTAANSYLWIFGDGGTSTLTNPSYVYNAGLFNVRLVAYNSVGCTDTAKAKARVLGYDGAVTYTPLSGCAPLTVQFTAHERNVPTFIYDFKDGSTYSTTDTFVTHTYTRAGGYVPLIILTDGLGCSSSSKGLDTIKVDGVIPGFTYSPYPACDKGTLVFLDTSKGTYSTINSTLWVFHDNVTSTSPSPSHSYNGPGTYNITLIHTTNTGCKDTMRTNVTFYPLPTIYAGLDTVICVSDSAIMMPTGGVSYSWSPAATLSCANCTHPFAFPSVPTLYTVVGTDTNGCTNRDSVMVMLQTTTTSSVALGGEICESDTMHLHAWGAHHYTWLPPYGLNDIHSPNPVASPDTSIVYMVIATEGSCIPDTNFVNVIVHPRPHVNAGPDQTITAGDVAQLNATGQHIVTYAWRPAEDLSCDNCQDPQATPKRTTTFIVAAYTEYGCHDSDDVVIKVICKSSQVYIPNTFTPNGDGQNDIFLPRGKGIRIITSFRIYDRWGEMIFEQKGINVNDEIAGWNGTSKGKELPPDVFVYMIDGICDAGEEFHWQGDISLIR